MHLNLQFLGFVKGVMRGSLMPADNYELQHASKRQKTKKTRITEGNMRRITLRVWNLSHRGLGSPVGIATGYGMDGWGIESRWGARYSAPVQTGSGAHPASCRMGTESFPEVKSGLSVTLTTHSLLVPRSKTE
jgi:hypothetical protein